VAAQIVLTSYGYPSFQMLGIAQLIFTVVILHVREHTGSNAVWDSFRGGWLQVLKMLGFISYPSMSWKV
jgi:hypothetical protein